MDQKGLIDHRNECYSNKVICASFEAQNKSTTAAANFSRPESKSVQMGGKLWLKPTFTVHGTVCKRPLISICAIMEVLEILLFDLKKLKKTLFR